MQTITNSLTVLVRAGGIFNAKIVLLALYLEKKMVFGSKENISYKLAALRRFRWESENLN